MLGKGQYGSVYKALDKQTNEYVALKMINKSKIVNDIENLIKSEIETLSKIPSSISEDDDFNYIIRYKDYLSTPKNSIIVMELVEDA